MNDETTIMEALAGEEVSHFAARMVAMAWETGGSVLGEFNSHTLEARPGATRDDVMREWNEAQWRSYFGDNRLAERNRTTASNEPLPPEGE